jgi:nitroimidazol reductase NimA-like FMN-containing flavoprotein (pyridoxamine 5'-phosphate oxidase superfamily)
MRRVEQGLGSKTAGMLRELLEEQHYAVLSTQQKGHPYCSLVAYVPTPDLRHGLFATHRSTNKYANLTVNPHVSLLIDNRRNTPDDVDRAVAVTITGTAREVPGDGTTDLYALYVARQPHLERFAMDDDCALFNVTVDQYTLVKQFEDVVVVRPMG